MKREIHQFQVNSPYDGCLWEWCYVYREGDNIHFLKHDTAKKWSSNLDDFKEKSYTGSFGWSFNCEKACKRDYKLARETGEDFYKYDIDNSESMDDMIKSCIEHDIVHISKVLYEHYNIEIYTKCSKCEESLPIHTFISTGYHGNGGVGVILTDFICEDCYCMGLCDDCGEYSDNTKQSNDGRYLCEFCRKCQMCGGDNNLNEYDVCEDCQESPEYKTALEKYKNEMAMFKYGQALDDTFIFSKPILKVETVK